VAARLLALGAVAACSKSGSPGAAALSATDGVEPAALQPLDPVQAEAWARAATGGEEDRIRLADLVGCVGLREQGESPERRLVALRAMSYCEDFSELPWLAAIAASGRDEEAVQALEAVVDQAARPRRATDPEDAQELGAGCKALLDLSRDTGKPRPRRVMAVRALRMLSERGCVKGGDIPSDLGAKE
jgi:hypothetical protein